MNTIEIENKLGITFCDRQNIAIERGEGVWVWDEGGEKYFDFTSGWGVTCMGHSHPVITAAIYNQARKIIQNPNSGFTYSPSRADLLAELKKILPTQLTHVYFANSGAEANDAALKLARKTTGRSKIVSTLASFHGRTFNTLKVSGGEDNAKKYLPLQANTEFVPFDDLEAIESVLDDNTAAVILEPVQGEGGVRIPDANYLNGVAALCKAAGALLIVDEIQTGFCRTGKFFAFQHSEQAFSPDILTMAKGIAGGFPFAAFAVSSEVNSKIKLGDHGGTFCGNPLGCSVASAVIAYLRSNDVAARVAKLGASLMQRLDGLLEKYPHFIKSVRGTGLLCALEFFDDASVKALTDACLDNHLLVTPTRNNVVRLIPSLLISEAELDEGVEILDDSLRIVASQARLSPLSELS